MSKILDTKSEERRADSRFSILDLRFAIEIRNQESKIENLRYVLLLFVAALLIFHTASAWSATISGKVGIEGRTDLSGVLVTAQQQENPNLPGISGITGTDGKYSIPSVPAGHFTLIAQKPGCLVEAQEVAIGEGNIEANFQLIPGDLKIDNQINLLDRIMLAKGWETEEGQAEWDSMLDIYQDGVIDEKDKDLLLSHWREVSDFKLGSLVASSEPSGARILINGADTGKTTPHTFHGMVVSKYTVTLSLEEEGYAPAEQVIQVNVDEVTSVDLVLDDQPPEFVDWTKDPANLTEDTQGRFRVLVTLVDKGGSGLAGKIPKFAYNIGLAGPSDYEDTDYKDMIRQSGDIWYYDVPEPGESWNAHRGEYVYYRARVQDVAGNEAESEKQQELIDDINDFPTVTITSTYDVWERGLLTIQASASDEDGDIYGVRFEYSFDNARWTQIGSMVTARPYSVSWDTTEVVREVAKNVWIRTTAIDDDNDSAEDITGRTFGIDNQPPATTHDYDRLWHTENFTVVLKASDGDGIGVARIAYILNNGTKQEIAIDGQASTSVDITTEGYSNVLEYWSVDQLENEESHKILSNIMLDKTDPVFSDWKQDPENLTEDTVGRFRISVRVTDEGGSGLEDKIPQIDYHIGKQTQYDGYQPMATEDGRVWNSDIPGPIDTWDAHRGESVYYKVKIEDVAGNVGESIEREELIDDINDPPTVSVTSRFSLWQKGLLAIEAQASDEDGKIAGVQFEYSSDKSNWIPIGPADDTAPFFVEWDTTGALLQAQIVWVQATAIDDGGTSVTYTYPAGIGIDNQIPTTSHDYDGLWHTEDFTIILTANDGNGAGVSSTYYRLNEGDEKNLATDGQPWVTREGTNQLEYWSVDNLGNVEDHNRLRDIKLDKTEPVFADWIQDPLDLTEDSTGFFRVSVRVMDAGGSGLTGQVPQFSYRIGRGAQYSEYGNMMRGEAGDVWYYDIPEPTPPSPPSGEGSGGWNENRGKYIYYRVKARDVAGNEGLSIEQQELIDDINDPPTVSIASTFDAWETGSLTIEAESSDTDGIIIGVQFEYSLDRVAWKPIGAIVTKSPYSVQWDTTTSIPEVAQTVWVKAIASDDDERSVEYIISNSFKVDNQPPITSHDYDGLWHNQDFAINLRASDGSGIGVAGISYRLDSGDIQDTLQASVPVNITTETEYSENVLEYWSVDRLGNEGSHEILTNIKLDKTAPAFSDWVQHPEDLTEDTTEEVFRVSVRVIDKGGSGLGGQIPQLDYRVGTDTAYDGYELMVSEDGIVWRFDIPEPTGSWDAYRGKNVYYKVRAEDVARNVRESLEQEELIDSVNDAPVVRITSTFKVWEGGQITVEAEASDVDGSVPSVRFEYSIDTVNWIPISVTITAPPYSVVWDTKTAIPGSAGVVWIRAIATDADDSTVSVVDVISKSFGVDNQPAVFGDWAKSPENLTEDTPGPFRVLVNVDDGIGSGVAKVELAHRIADGLATIYSRAFAEMKHESGNLWYYDIPEPSGTWDRYRGKTLYYRAFAVDAVGNQTPETPEQQELIDDINDLPEGLITSTYKDWERGSISIFASAEDKDGEIASVQFQYSRDNVTWTNIDSPRTRIPYTVTWNTAVIDVDADVWLRIVITDDDGASVEAVLAKSFGIDNKAPTFVRFSHTNLTEDFEDIFRVEAEITDAGSGLDNSKVLLSYRIGTTGYSEYRNMIPQPGTNKWFYEIPRPAGNWGNYAGEKLFYRVKAADIAGNSAESNEQQELIDPTTGSISGTITPRDSWFSNATVAAQQNSVDVKQVSVSRIDGSYSITKLRPGSYDLVVAALGYGTDRSMKGIPVIAGEDRPNNDVELHTYAVENITRSQGGMVEYKDKAGNEYKLVIPSNTLDGNVALGFSGKEPTNVTNPTVFLDKAIGLGFKGGSIDRPIELVMPRPTGITDVRAVMTFIYDGSQDYKFVERDVSTTVTITIDTGDVGPNFRDQDHNFHEALGLDTVFYALITEFNEPQISSSTLGIRDPQSPYSQVSISTAARRIALVTHGIISESGDFTNLIGSLKAMEDREGQPYYDRVLVFNYDPSESVEWNAVDSTNSLMNALENVFGNFDGKIDMIAHGMGALVARRAITDDFGGADEYIGSLTMLGAPHGGVEDDLLKGGFTDFLEKTPSDPAWTYYRDGWRDIVEDSSFLSTLNNQLTGKIAKTHYYGIAVAAANDGLVSLTSGDFTDNSRFPRLEQPLTETFYGIPVQPPNEGSRFMSGTTHVGMINSPDVIEWIITYLQGKSEDIRYEKYEGDLIPGQRIADFTVELRNDGADTVYGVSAKLSTQNIYIRKDSGQQGIEKDTATFGDIPKDSIKSDTFIFTVSSNATSAIGELVTFTLLITNSRDNSISIEEFTVPIGGNLVQIALDQTDKKMVFVDVSKDASRPENDGDIAVESGEIMELDITLVNNSTSAINNVMAVLKTTDPNVTGLDTTGDEIDIANDGILVEYGTLFGGVPKSSPSPFQFVKVDEDLALTTQIQVHFTLDIKSGSNFIGSDEFDVTVGADIVVESVDIDEDVIPGGPPVDRGIEVTLRNITASDIEDVETRIRWDPNVVDMDDDEVLVGQIRAGRTRTAEFDGVEIDDPDFAGYVYFTLEIKVDNAVINIEPFRYYFGKRTQYVSYWITQDEDPDDGDGDNNGIAQPGEEVYLQIARQNLTDEEVRDVEAKLLDPFDDVIVSIDEDDGDYRDIPAYEVEEARREYEFTVADAGDITVDAPSGSILTETTLSLPGATWIPHAFVDGTLNPNTDQAVVYTITDNDEDTIEVELDSNPPMNDPAVAQNGDPFEITVDPFNEFGLEGHTVEFTLEIEEDGKSMGQETFTLRIGGIVRYLPPDFDDLMRAVSDSTSLGPNNNGNDKPEPGEIIEIEVTLINISDDRVDNVVAKLNPIGDNRRDVDIVGDDDYDFGDIRDGRTEQGTYTIEIDENIEGSKMTFELEIEGEVDSGNEKLGTDVFVIPVYRIQSQ